MNERTAEITKNASILDQLKIVIRRNLRQYAILMALITIIIIFQIATKGILLKPINVYRLIGQNSYILIMSIGMTLCILTGGNIDLSVGSIVAFVSACSALFSVTWGLPAGLAIFLGLLMGLLAGFWQGFWIAHVKIPSFIATLAGMLLFRGLNNLLLNGLTIPLPDLYVTIASGSIPDFLGAAGLQVPNFITGSGVFHVTTIIIVFIASLVLVLFMFFDRKSKAAHGFILGSFTAFMVKTVSLFIIINIFGLWLAAANGFPYVLFLLVSLIIIYSFIANKTVAGRHVYAVGGNEKAAALSGVNIKKVMFWVYANMGLLAGLAGIVFAGRLNAASPLAGKDFELDVIAACFIGGASMKGGEGTIIGGIIGGLIMGILNNGMSILGFNIFIQSVIKGLVLLAAVSFDVYSKSKTTTRTAE